MPFKVPPALHVALCIVLLFVTLGFGGLAAYLLVTGQTVPTEVWKLAGGSMLGYGFLKAQPDDAHSDESEIKQP
jgi:hypothetical protein